MSARPLSRTLRWISASAIWVAAPALAAFPDINGDHVVDGADTQDFFDAVAGGNAGSAAGPAPLSVATADLDHDGKVGLSDALLFGRYVDGLHADPAMSLAPIPFRNPADLSVFRNYAADLKSKSAWNAATLASHYPIAFGPDPGYPAGSIQYESDVGAFLSKSMPAQSYAAFIDKVHAQGFAVAGAKTYPNYFAALDDIHSADLPLLFTIDALLHTVYLSYDSVLVELENNLFIPSLNAILLGSLDYAEKNYATGNPALDVQDQLLTALRLLDRSRADVPSSPSVDAFLALVDAQQMSSVKLYGKDTMVDFSQFKPRGHYTQSAKLKAYFQAMMWLSRADLAFDLRPKSDSAGSFARTKQAALILWDCLVNSGTYADWIGMNAYIEYMVGQSDGLNAKGMGVVAEAMKIKTVPEALPAFNEARFDSALAATGLGGQAILSQSKSYSGPTQNLDLSPIFSFMPQRFILDSYTFSQMVYPVTGALMPSGMHAAFALGDNSVLLDSSFSGGVPGSMGAQRALYDGISAEGWQSNLYMSWLGFLRKLNGAEGNAKVSPVFRTRAWREKMRNTQLASWAQLRHNTILYAKQSYTGTTICSFPKAYVEPYPEFFAAVAAYAHAGAALFKSSRPPVADYFSKLEDISGRLGDIAKNTALGLSPTDAQAQWLETALVSHPPAIPMCGAVKTYDGWYFDLLYARPSQVATAKDWTIADVHTHPRDDSGPDMVLEVGTGAIQLAAIAVQEDSCVTMYVGPVGSYYEILHTGDLNRMTDDDWLKSFGYGSAQPTPAQPAWTKSYLVP